MWSGVQIAEIIGGPTVAYYASFAIRAIRAIMAVSWFYFTMTYAGYGNVIHSTTSRIVIATGTLILLVFTSIPSVATALTFETVQIASDQFHTVELAGTTPVRWVTQSIGYSFVGVGTIALAYRLINTRYTRWWQTILFLGSVSAVIVFDIGLENNTLLVPGVDYSVVGTSLVSGLFILALYRGDLFSFGPVARDHVFHTIDDAVAVVNPDHKIIDYNDAAKSIWGDELRINSDISTLLPDEVIADGGLMSQTGVRTTVTLTPHGSRRYYEMVVSPLEEMSREGVVIILRDTTEREKREQGLRQLHDATQDLMDAETAEEVATIGSETAKQVLESPITSIYLYNSSREELLPAAWSDKTGTFFDGSPPAFSSDEVLSDYEHQTGESEVLTEMSQKDPVLNPETQLKSKVQIPIGEHGVLIAGSTSRGDFVAIDEVLAKVLATNIESALDRVEREEKLQRQNEQLDEFVGIVSHDLRNPLQVAHGRLELAQMDCDSGHLDNVAAALDRMNTLIDDLLTLAREGSHVGESEPVSLAEIITSCWENVETGDATLVVETNHTIQGDSSRLKQLFENLIRNAVEHGGESVTVEIGDLDGGFYIADDGVGIPEDEREQVFATGYSTADEGTGFGLNILQEIVHAHDWKISITDSKTGGARFEITGVNIVAE